MDNKLLVLYEHRDLLRCLGYEIELPIIDLLVRDEDGYKKSLITKNSKSVGEIGLEERNMYYLYRDNRFVGNKDLATISFSKNKKKNIRTLVHTKLFDNKLKINCFNMLHSIGRTDAEDRSFICLSDCYSIMISKYLNEDEADIISLLEDVPNESILDYLRNNEKKTLTYKLGDELNEYKN